MGFRQWRTVWKKNCLKSENCFHNHTNIETRVTLKRIPHSNAEYKIHSSGISGPFYLCLARIPGRIFFFFKTFLWRDSNVHTVEKEIFFACRFPLRMFTQLSSKLFVVLGPSAQRWKQYCMTVAMDSTTRRTEQLQRRNTASNKWSEGFASVSYFETGFQGVSIRSFQITNTFLKIGL